MEFNIMDQNKLINQFKESEKGLALTFRKDGGVEFSFHFGEPVEKKEMIDLLERAHATMQLFLMSHYQDESQPCF